MSPLARAARRTHPARGAPRTTLLTRSSQRAERSPSLDKSVPASPGLAPNGLYYRTALHESSALNSYSALLSDVFTRFEAERATRRDATHARCSPMRTATRLTRPRPAAPLDYFTLAEMKR